MLPNPIRYPFPYLIGIGLLIWLIMQIPSCEKVNDYGMAYNPFRSKLGVPLKKEMVDNLLSTSDDKKEGFSMFHLHPRLERLNRLYFKPYYRSKSIYFFSNKITQEEDNHYYPFNDSSEWHMSTITTYTKKEVDGFIVLIRNGHSIDSTNQKIDQHKRDSILRLWGLR